MKKRWILSSLFALLLLSACGGKQPVTQDNGPIDEMSEVNKKKQKEKESFEMYALDTNDAEAWMRLEPGKYSEKERDSEAIKKEIEAWPEGLSAEEYFARLMALTADDYRPYQTFIDETEVIFSAITDQPDGLNAPGDAGDAPLLHTQILLDASGSMAGRLDGKTKMQLAKEAVAEFVSGLPENTLVSLRVYGHKGSNQPAGKEESCAKTEEIYQLSGYEQQAFSEALNRFEPTGFTPLARAIEEGGQDLLAAAVDNPNVKSVMYVVSDGEETCGGDPVEAARQIQESEIEAVVNIIGFDIESHERAALEAIASAGNGKYFHADTGKQLRDSFRKETTELINAWYTWDSKNVNTFYTEEADYLNASYTHESKGVNQSYSEETFLVNLTREMEEIRADIPWRQIRPLIQDRARGMRVHMKDHFRDIRVEARETARQLRIQVRDKARDERIDLREQQRSQ
ncbi:hypothetical protein BEP19_01385 [Ammoniphilus oxalaticus]|uniref:VWFA domain-containing protein n=1 Tax=Ammoniphilus oxalaticus TaxID=66863 RepID=A0A419SMV5_9BACL|nr:VWA domain-containing protein [Ammoniphilus oxalaticus]RKD25624.1 hypothetical protein BEP19_01385 [Ammoniphilus oxalaticus]